MCTGKGEQGSTKRFTDRKRVQKDLVAGEIQLVSMVICLIMAVWLLYLNFPCKYFLNHLRVTSHTYTCAVGTRCQLLINWFVSWVWAPGHSQRYWVVLRDLQICTHLWRHACTHPGSIVNFHLYQWKKRRQTQLFVSGFFIWVLCVGAVEGNGFSVTICPIGCVSVLYPLHTSLGYVLSVTTVEPTKKESSSHTPQPGQRSWVPGWAPVTGQEEVLNQRGWRRQPCS